MPRHALAPPDVTRDAILDAALALFARLGYAKTTVADIAGALRMSPTNVYRFYPAKAAINDAICRRMLTELRRQMQARAHAPEPPAQRITALILLAHRWHRDQLTTRQHVHAMVDAAMAEHWEAVEEHRTDCAAILAAVIAEGQRDGAFLPGDPRRLAQTALAACCSLLHPTVIAQQAGADAPDEQPARDLAWLVVQALRNRQGEPLP